MVIFLGLCLFAGLVIAGFLPSVAIYHSVEEWTQLKHWELHLKMVSLRLDFEAADLECPEFLEDAPDWDEEPEDATVIRLVPKETIDEPSTPG